jgi:ammonium transporter, Amt family
MQVNTGDLTWVLVSCAMVLLMTPGLAFFYGGMVRRKNVLNTMMSSYGIMGMAAIMWVVIGYTMSFGPNLGGVIGDFSFAGLAGVGGTPNPDYAPTIPVLAFAVFQMMFAIITPALITGAVAERMKFSVQLIFALLWSVVVYYPLAHMIWGAGGWLRNLGVLDFAGGFVVHISAGTAGLIASIMLGKRKTYGISPPTPHNIPFVLLGAALLWFGWFGFNGGSALSSSVLAVQAFLTTNTSAAAAMLSWMLMDRIANKKPTALGAATGLVVGLVAITPAAGYVPIWAAIVIGLVASPVCWFCISTLKRKFGYDDALDVFGCHGVGSIWGVIATGLFASSSVNPAVTNQGLIYGSGNLMVAQLIALGVTVALSGVGTFVILKVTGLFTKIRVTQHQEKMGLDHSLHGESAYPSFTGMD